jgi:hypothetical protein
MQRTSCLISAFVIITPMDFNFQQFQQTSIKKFSFLSARPFVNYFVLNISHRLWIWLDFKFFLQRILTFFYINRSWGLSDMLLHSDWVHGASWRSNTFHFTARNKTANLNSIEVVASMVLAIKQMEWTSSIYAGAGFCRWVLRCSPFDFCLSPQCLQ